MSEKIEGERRSGFFGKLLDRTIVFSFDANGYRRHARDFQEGDLDVDLSGKVCLVTGANAGIGRATAKGLAQRGATVYLLCRNEGRGLEAQDSLRQETDNPNIHVEVIDMSRLDSVRAFAERFAPDRVDVLVHNAGVMVHDLTFTEDDYEISWATNVLGPFLLTRLLEPKLEAADASRVLWVSSGGMYTEKLRITDLRWQRHTYDGVVAYAQTKRAEVVLAELMDERLQPKGITVHAMHPGWVDTGSVQQALPRFHKVTKSILRTAEQGADTLVWLAACPRLAGEPGAFWFDRARAPTHYLKRTRETDPERAALWAECERSVSASA